MFTSRKEAIEYLKTKEPLSRNQKQALSLWITTADVQGDYTGRDEDDGSVWCDSVQDTLDCMAKEISEI